MTIYEVQPEHEEYVVGEEVRLRITLENHGAETVSFPDPGRVTSAHPTYTLTGPGYPDGLTFSQQSLARENRAPDLLQAVRTAPEIRVEPGQKWEGLLPLSGMLRSLMPGEYRLASRLQGTGLDAKSPERSFRLDRLTPISVHLGQGTLPLGSGEGTGAFIHRAGSAGTLYAFRYSERRPDISEMHLRAPIRRMAVTAGAADVGVPWKNSPLFDELLTYIIWREGQSVKAVSDISKTPLSVELPEPLQEVVRPPLKRSSEPAEALAVSAGGTSVYLVRFSQQAEEPAKAAELAWKAALPEKPGLCGAAIAPPEQGSRRHFAFAVQQGEEVRLYHSRYAAQAQPEPFRSVSLGRGRLLPHAPLALAGDREGRAYASVLLVTDEALHRYARVEAAFGSAGEPLGDPKVTDLGRQPARPIAGGLLYACPQGQVTRRDAVLLLEDGQVLRLAAPGEMRPVSVRGIPTRPILLAPGRHATYVLYFDPNDGLYFEPL